MHWTAYLTALSTPTLALFALLIAYRQWSTARTKLKLDLFDKRHKVYTAAVDLIRAVVRNGNVSDQDLFTFFESTNGVSWLFNSEIAEYFSKGLYSKALDLQQVNEELQCMREGQERQEKLRVRRELKDWFYTNQLTTLKTQMTPFLQIEQVSLLRKLWRAIPCADFGSK